MKRVFSIFTASLFSLMISGQGTGTTPTDTTKKKIDSSKIVSDSILRVFNLDSQRDSAKFKDIIAIKLQTQRPISDFTTLYINGIKVEGCAPWKQKACDAMVFFPLNENVRHLVDSFVKNRSAEKKIVPVYVSVGTTNQCLAKTPDPIYLEVNSKINKTLAWIISLGLLIIAVVAVLENALKDDNNLYYSLARVQLFYWTLVFTFAYLYICFTTGLMPDIPNSALIILGISVATTAAGKMVDNRDKDKAPIDPGAHSQGLFLDILSDGSSINIHRFQNVIFNLVFGIIFIQKVITTLTLPDFEDTVLVLLGLSSGAYAGLKITEATKDQQKTPPPTGDDPSPAPTVTPAGGPVTGNAVNTPVQPSRPTDVQQPTNPDTNTNNNTGEEAVG